MRNLFRDYVLSNGGSFHDLNEILAGRFADRAMAKRCAQDLAALCELMLVDLEVTDEWLWLFLPQADRPRPHSRENRHTQGAAPKPVAPPPLAQPFYRHRLQADRVFCLHDPLTGRADWLFESREGLQGPFATKAMAEKALAEFVRSCEHRPRDQEPGREPHGHATTAPCRKRGGDR